MQKSQTLETMRAVFIWESSSLRLVTHLPLASRQDLTGRRSPITLAPALGFVRQSHLDQASAKGGANVVRVLSLSSSRLSWGDLPGIMIGGPNACAFVGR